MAFFKKTNLIWLSWLSGAMDPGEARVIAMNNIVLSDPDGQDPDMTGRGQKIEADNLGLGGGVESSNTFDLKYTSEEEVIEEFNRFEQEEIRNSSFCQEGRMSTECC